MSTRERSKNEPARLGANEELAGAPLARRRFGRVQVRPQLLTGHARDPLDCQDALGRHAAEPLPFLDGLVLHADALGELLSPAGSLDGSIDCAHMNRLQPPVAVRQQPSLAIKAGRLQRMVVPSTEQAKRAFAARLKRAFLEVEPGGPERGLAIRVSKHFGKEFTYQAVQKWLNAEAMPGMAHIVLICQTLRISVDWLFAGEGQMRIADRERGYWPFTFEQRRFNELTKGQKIAIEGAIEGMIVDYEEARPTRPRSAGR